jgi:hypothetical protein
MYLGLNMDPDWWGDWPYVVYYLSIAMIVAVFVSTERATDRHGKVTYSTLKSKVMI